MTKKENHKKCPICKKYKPLRLFYYDKDKYKTDGYSSRCKFCLMKLLEQKRGTPEYKARQLEYSRKWYANNKTYYKEYVKKKRSENPEQASAYIILNNAIQTGAIIRPSNCEECGSTKNIQAHHEDYSKPLDVKWLCAKCHNKKHHRLQTVLGRKLLELRNKAIKNGMVLKTADEILNEKHQNRI